LSGSTVSRTARVCSKVKELPAGEVMGLVGHSQSKDTFGIYGHALQGEDAATSGKLSALFETLAAPAQEQGEGEAYKKTCQEQHLTGRKNKKSGPKRPQKTESV
jgi:hypothetical protein